MPILPAEPELYPANLWHDDNLEVDGVRRWWCLHTKPRQEKTMARALRSRKIAHYLPQVAQERRTPQGRRIRSVIPLFPGYLFLLGDSRQRVDALQGNHLVNILDVIDQESLVRDLRRLHRVLSSGLPVVAETVHEVGTNIRVLAGPLKGVTGTIVRRQGRDRFVAIVHFLGRGAAIDLQDWQVETIPADAQA